MSPGLTALVAGRRILEVLLLGGTATIAVKLDVSRWVICRQMKFGSERLYASEKALAFSSARVCSADS
jgi:hypothetical protein